MHTLYISYDGVLEPLGQSQVAAYLKRVSPRYRQTLISFEKPGDLRDRERVRRLKEGFQAAGITWVCLRYHKRPPVLSTLLDGLLGVLAGLYVCITRPVRIVHARGYVPALVSVVLKRLAGPRFVFDMRGFWADEKVDGGQWSRTGRLYAITKWCERLFFREADAVVSLTAAGVKAFSELGYGPRGGVPVQVIPTCTDVDRFKPGLKDRDLLAQLGLEGHRIVGCVGTLSNWYLREATLAYVSFLAGRIDGVKVLIVTQEDHDLLRRDAADAGIASDRLVLTRAEYSAMPDYVRLFDLGVFFIRVCFSKKGSCATKLGEFLACGVPVVINDGIGDSGSIVRSYQAGLVLPEAAPRWYSVSEVEALWRDQRTSERCRRAALERFDLRAGVEAYERLYERLSMRNGGGEAVVQGPPIGRAPRVEQEEPR